MRIEGGGEEEGLSLRINECINLHALAAIRVALSRIINVRWGISVLN